MKKHFLLIVFLLGFTSLFAQKQKVKHLTTFDDKFIHFGFTIGVNVLDFNITHHNPIGNNPDFGPQDGITASDYVRADIAEPVPGFTVAIVSSMRLARDLDIRFQPGMSFGERKLRYNIPVEDINVYSPEPYYTYSIKSTFLDFPVLFKYKARRINNDRPYVVFGPAYRLDISRTAQEDLVKLKNSGLYAEVGAGWDHYFPFFRFSIEAKYSFGLNNMLGDVPAPSQKQYYSQGLKYIQSNVFTLSFHFE